MTELHPWAMLAKGPPCTKAAVCSVVWTRFGERASSSNAVMAPPTPRSFTVKGLSSVVYPSVMFSMRLRRSSSSVARHSIAIISDAGVMSKPVSLTIPLALPPSPVTTSLNPRSLMSSTRFHRISFKENPLSLFWYM